MRIAIVHGFYRSDVPSGENVAVRAQVEALRADGNDVTVVAQHSDDRMTRATWPLEAAATTITGQGPDPTAALAEADPDVVHVHNLYPHFGTRWLERWSGPLVATLHNFRPLCAAGTLTREGRRCTDCVLGSAWSGVRHGCYHGSRLATVPLAFAHRGGAAVHPVVRRADRLVAISERAADEYGGAGVGRERFAVVPNFVPDPPAAAPQDGDERWLFTGRLSGEKGLRELLAAWPADRSLDVVGDGEEADELRALAGPNVTFLGTLPHAVSRALPGHYRGVVVPSQWPEAGPPLTYLEAIAAGTPVVACAGNGAADDIARHGTGVVVGRTPEVGEVAAALDTVLDRREVLARRCRVVATERYTAAAWVAAITEVYRDAIDLRALAVTRG
ncbi:glycosyltransferase family 4 protein [Actinomycetospora sp. C-140]